MPEEPEEPGGEARPEGETGAPPHDAPPRDAQPHDPAGLDLAREAARAAAAAGGDPARRRRRRTGPGGPGTESGRRTRGRGGLSGPRPDDRDPQPLDGELSRLVTQRGWALDLRVHAVLGRWKELVGDEVADHCTPESFVDGRLVVRTDSTAWATQLRLLAPTLLRRLNAEVGDGTVTAIQVQGPQAPSWKRGPRSVRDGRGPRDTYG